MQSAMNGRTYCINNYSVAHSVISSLACLLNSFSLFAPWVNTLSMTKHVGNTCCPSIRGAQKRLHGKQKLSHSCDAVSKLEKGATTESWTSKCIVKYFNIVPLLVSPLRLLNSQMSSVVAAAQSSTHNTLQLLRKKFSFKQCSNVVPKFKSGPKRRHFVVFKGRFDQYQWIFKERAGRESLSHIKAPDTLTVSIFSLISLWKAVQFAPDIRWSQPTCGPL